MFDPDRSPNSNSPSKPQVILSLRTAVILMRCEFIISLIQKICYLSRGNPIIARLICTPQIASWATKFEESTLDIAKLFWVFCNNKVFGPYSSIQVVR